MDLLILLRDAQTSSLLDAFFLARQGKRRGQEVAIVLTQEALVAVASGTYGWPRELSGQHMRYAMADAGSQMGLPVKGRGEGRQLDWRALLDRAAEEGIPIYGNLHWLELTGLRERLPASVRPIGGDELMDLLESSKRIIGTL
ncbi:MAG TPA: hypothetical protein VNL95_06725 [Dehalococcoidia bacterium]|nr:hypothetical protein [Dehalococcoidia bacterium]